MKVTQETVIEGRSKTKVIIDSQKTVRNCAFRLQIVTDLQRSKTICNSIFDLTTVLVNNESTVSNSF